MGIEILLYLVCLEFAPQNPRFDCSGVIGAQTTLRNGMPGILKIGTQVQLK
jgi:hypothetical protein